MTDPAAPMTGERERDVRAWYEVNPDLDLAANDARALLAEVDRLRAELAAARAERDAMRKGLEQAAKIRVLCGNCGRRYSVCRLCGIEGHSCGDPTKDVMLHDPDCTLAARSGPGVGG